MPHQKGDAKNRHPTLRDIAALARVAPMTVSRVINQSGYVSRELRERVERAIEQLEYHPNALARSLKARRTRVIGILLPDIANPFAAELAGSIQEVLLERGYSAFITTTDQKAEREQAALSAFFEHRVDGVIIATVQTKASAEALRKFTRRGMPIVTVGRALNMPATDRVTADYWKGGYDAVEHLIRLGHKRIAFIGASLLRAGALRRFQGYLDALRDHNLPVQEELIIGAHPDLGPGYSTQTDGYEGMKRLLQLPLPPTAVFARNDFTALGAMCAVRDHGLSIPQDVAIVGFDNIPMARSFTPSLTTVDQSTAEQGRKAALMLLERIEGTVQGDPREVCFDCRLIVRESTAKRKAGRKILKSGA